MSFETIFQTDVQAADLKVSDPAPLFQTRNQEGEGFDLASRKGKWTILYFYPKADTPGCTKQACAFRDSLEPIKKLNAEVFGVSADEVKSLAAFHKKYHLNFPLLADPKGTIINSYGTKMPVLTMSKRWTFVIDPELRIRHIDQNVDPVSDPTNMIRIITELSKKG